MCVRARVCVWSQQPFLVATFSETDISYRLGGDSGYKGPVYVSLDGSWGTVCGSYFSSYEATAFCHSQGFHEGRVDFSNDSYPNTAGRMYQATILCRGDEASLEDCPHEGWRLATSTDCTPDNVANVICFNDGEDF